MPLGCGAAISMDGAKQSKWQQSKNLVMTVLRAMQGQRVEQLDAEYAIRSRAPLTSHHHFFLTGRANLCPIAWEGGRCRARAKRYCAARPAALIAPADLPWQSRVPALSRVDTNWGIVQR